MVKYILILLCVFSSAKASETRIGYGYNHGILIPEIGGIGSWVQKDSPLDNGIEQNGRVIAIQRINNTRISWLDYGIGLAYRTGPTASGGYVSDPCYVAKQFSGGACDRHYYANLVDTKTTALTVTINPTWRAKDISFSLGIGVSIHSSQVSTRWDRTKGWCSVGSCEDLTFKERGITPYIETSIKYKSTFITMYYADGERGPESMSDGNYGIIAGFIL